MADYMYKIILVGEASVGKSSIINRFADDSFEESYLSTIGVDFKFKTLQIDGKSAKLTIWDTAGQERFRTIVRAFYKGTQGIAIVFDATAKGGLEGLQTFWLGEVQENAEKSVKVLVLANKVDILSEEQLAKVTLQLQQFTKKHNVQGYLVSAKTGKNISVVFQNFTRQCIATFGVSTKASSQMKTILEDIKKKNAEYQQESTEKSNKFITKCC